MLWASSLTSCARSDATGQRRRSNGVAPPWDARPIVLSKTSVIELFGPPDAVLTKDEHQVGRFIAGETVLLYYRTRSATLHLAMGFSDDTLVDAAYVDFGNKRGVACARMELVALPPGLETNGVEQ